MGSSTRWRPSGDAESRRDSGRGFVPPSVGGDALPRKQAETLRLALETGYFDVPRDVTLQDLADELGVSDQTVSERLRRGIATVVDDALEDELDERLDDD